MDIGRIEITMVLNPETQELSQNLSYSGSFSSPIFIAAAIAQLEEIRKQLWEREARLREV